MSDEQNPFGTSYRSKPKTKKEKRVREKTAEPDPPAPSRSDDRKSVAYRIGSKLQERINKHAEANNVEKGSFAKWLLLDALERFENGEIELPEQVNVAPKRLNV